MPSQHHAHHQHVPASIPHIIHPASQTPQAIHYYHHNAYAAAPIAYHAPAPVATSLSDQAQVAYAVPSSSTSQIANSNVAYAPPPLPPTGLVTQLSISPPGSTATWPIADNNSSSTNNSSNNPLVTAILPSSSVGSGSPFSATASPGSNHPIP
jgi:hypothetical protein